MKTSSAPRTTLATFGLGSCVAVTFYDRITQVAALLHAQLPSAKDNGTLARKNPYAFVDSGLAATLDVLELAGCSVSRLIVTAAGGATMRDGATVGERNCAALAEAVRRWGLHVDTEHLGRNFARTVLVSLPEGRVTVRSAS